MYLKQIKNTQLRFCFQVQDFIQLTSQEINKDFWSLQVFVSYNFKSGCAPHVFIIFYPKNVQNVCLKNPVTWNAERKLFKEM